MTRMDAETEPFFNFRNVLILLGIIITTVGLVYFATEFSDIISDWGRVLDLALLTVIYVSLGVHFSETEDSTTVIARKGWRWMRVTTALFLLGLVAGFSGVIAFLSVDALSRVVKLLTVVVLGLALIVGGVLVGRHSRIGRPVLIAALGGLTYATLNVMGDYMVRLPGRMPMFMLLMLASASAVATLVVAVRRES